MEGSSMGKSFRKTVIMGIAAISMVFALAVCFRTTSYAATTKTYPTAYCMWQRTSGHLMRIGTDRKYIQSVKSSNPNVIAIWSQTNPQDTNYCTNGPGTCTITYKMKKGGKVYTAKQKYVVYKVNPFKSFKLNGKEYAPDFNKEEGTQGWILKSDSKKNNKIQWKLNSGFKIVKYSKKQYDNTIYNFSSNNTLNKAKGTKTFKGTRDIYAHIKDKKGRYLGCYKICID